MVCCKWHKMCLSVVTWTLLGLVMTWGEPGYAYFTKFSVKPKEDVLPKKTVETDVVKSLYKVPYYLQKMYRMFETISGDSKIQDLTVHALKPSKMVLLSGKRIQYEFKGNHDLLKHHMNQVEIVIGKNITKNQPQSVAVKVCWNKVSCSNYLKLLQEDEFLIGDITNSTKTFFSTSELRKVPDKLKSITVTTRYLHHLQQTGTNKPIIVFHSVSKSHYSPFWGEFYNESQWMEERDQEPRPGRKRHKRHTEDEEVEFEYDGPCKLHHWNIRFSEIGWGNWIIMPKQYRSNLCAGKCDTPEVINKVNLSSHAYIRHMYYQAHDGIVPFIISDNTKIRVPKPCCIPVEFNPMSTLFKNKDDTLTLKRVDEAVVTRCGCL